MRPALRLLLLLVVAAMLLVGICAGEAQTAANGAAHADGGRMDEVEVTAGGDTAGGASARTTSTSSKNSGVTAAAETLSYEERAIPLLLSDATNSKLVVQDEGVELLYKLGDTPLALVFVAGPARSGKSFLLNNLLKIPQSKGFGVCHTPKGCTKGVWLWGHPEFVTIDGERVAVLFMDSEGFGAVGNPTETYDPKLCVFSALFASTFLYNILHAISMENIKFLSTVAQLDDVFKRQFRVGFPMAVPLWVVQDFQFDVSGFNPPNAEGYLDFAYSRKEVSGRPGEDSRDLVQYNRIVDMIAEKFPSQQPPRIKLLSHPKLGTPKQRLTELALPDLDAEYQGDVEHLRAIVDSRIAIKRFGNFTVTGSVMAQLTLELIPKLNAVDQSAADIMADMALVVAAECFKFYQGQIDNVALPVRTGELKSVHTEASAAALEKFGQTIIGPQELRENEEARDKLNTNIGHLFKARVADNREIAHRHCDELMSKGLSDVQTCVANVQTGEVVGDTCFQLLKTIEADFEVSCTLEPEDKAVKIARFKQAAAGYETLLAQTESRRVLTETVQKCFASCILLFITWMLIKAFSTCFPCCSPRFANLMQILFVLSVMVAVVVLLAQLNMLATTLSSMGIKVTDRQVAETITAWLVWYNSVSKFTSYAWKRYGEGLLKLGVPADVLWWVQFVPAYVMSVLVMSCCCGRKCSRRRTATSGQ